MTGRTVLVVDDKRNMIALLERVLGERYAVVSAANGQEALKLLGHQPVDVIVSDIVMPEVDGMELLMRARRQSPSTQIILMTGYGTVEQAVQAVKAGAFDYVTKPFDLDEMARTVDKAMGLTQRFLAEGAWPGVIGRSAAMQRIFRMMESVRTSDTTVLLTGESGTGKGLIARALHSGGNRAGRRFVVVNCGAIPRDLIEAELMGHSAGAFTGATVAKKGLAEEANGGTLFLDEISELPADLQVKMNTLVQDRELRRIGEVHPRRLDARFIAATNRDLKAMIQEKTFRADLFYRLNVFPIEVPPLRDRRDDIPLLADRQLAITAAREGKRVETVPARIQQALVAYDWPGNVRELENVIERAVILASGDELEESCFPNSILEGKPAPDILPPDLCSLTYRQVMEVASETATRRYFEEVLALHNGNVTRAAVHAGLERQSLHRLLRRYGLQSQAFKD